MARRRTTTRRRGAGLMDLARKGVQAANDEGMFDDMEGQSSEIDTEKLAKKMTPMVDLMIKMKRAGLEPTPPQGGRRSRKTRRSGRKTKRSRSTR